MSLSLLVIILKDQLILNSILKVFSLLFTPVSPFFQSFFEALLLPPTHC